MPRVYSDLGVRTADLARVLHLFGCPSLIWDIFFNSVSVISLTMALTIRLMGLRCWSASFVCVLQKYQTKTRIIKKYKVDILHIVKIVIVIMRCKFCCFCPTSRKSHDQISLNLLDKSASVFVFMNSVKLRSISPFVHTCANTGHEAICKYHRDQGFENIYNVLFDTIWQHDFQLIFVEKKEKRPVCASPSAVSRHVPARSLFPLHPPLLISQRSLSVHHIGPS